MGGAPAAVEAYKSAPTPNVVVLEAPAGRDALLGQLEELAQYCDAGTKVVVLGKLNDIVLYRQLIARGVSEYLVTPFGVVDFVQAMSQLFSVPGAKPLGRVIAVVGAKGGVGASTVAHNLAWSSRLADRNGDDHRRLRSGVRNRRTGLQSGPAPGRRRGGVRPGTGRHRAGRAASLQVRRPSQPSGGARHARSRPRLWRGFVQLARRRHAGVNAVGRARRPASVVGLGPADPRRRGRGCRGCKPGSGQSSQREKPHRQREGGSPQRCCRRGWS